MKKIVRGIGIAASALVIAAGLGVAVAAPASAASNCQATAIEATPGGYKASVLCTQTDPSWSISVDGNGASGSWGQTTKLMTFKSVGNTPDAAVANAAWMAYNSDSSRYCTDVATAAIPGGYNVVYTCPGGRWPFPNGAAGDLNTAVSWANYQWILYR